VLHDSIMTAAPSSGTPMGTTSPPNREKSVLRRLVHDYVGKQWPIVALAVVCMLIAAGANATIPVLLKFTVKFLFVKKKADMLWPITLAILALMSIRAATWFGQKSLIDTVGERIVAGVQRDIFDSLVARDLASLNAVHSAQFVSGFIYDVNLIRDAVATGISAMALQSVQLVAFAIVMFYQDWQLALISILALPAVAWAMERIGGSLRRAVTRGMEQTGTLSTALSEALDGRRIIKAYGLESYVSQRAHARIASRLRTLLKAVRRRAATAPATDLFVGMVLAGTIFFAGYQSLHGQLDIGKFSAFIAAMLLAQEPVRNLSQFWPLLSSGSAAATRVFAVIDAKPSIADRPGAIALTIPPAPKGGAVKFQNVGFSYLAEAGEPALDGINFEVAPGQKVALVGPSGAGKSTIFNLLLRFYDINRGRIEIDGHDIMDVTLQTLRGNIALVTQDPILFDESVAENISLGRLGATRAEIETAARDAAAHEFIVQLPEGYDTRVGEGGLKLSGGQRQRIAIARAMLRNAPILLLDEATSALDTESERQVQEALTRLMKNRTTIVIAHRLTTVVDADRIFVLDRGTIVESGTHGELIARGGLYARLYQHDFDDVPAAKAG